MSKSLEVLLYGLRVGEVRQGAAGKLSFSYDRNWLENGPRIPLSLSMPLSSPTHGHDRIAPYMWGLLPDNADIRRTMARELGGKINPENPFSMLGAMGEDCAGAVQFAPADRVAKLTTEGSVRWLNTAEVEAMLSRVRRKLPPTSEGPIRGGRYSVAGAQPKIALHWGPDGQWGAAFGRTPTTHILKPPMAGMDGQVENEHFCLALAHALRLPSAWSDVLRFGEEVAIVSQRYDRVPRPDGSWARLHQEDMCQALSVTPDRKYQNEGGPSPEQILDEVLRQTSAPDTDALGDIRTFMGAVTLTLLF